MHPNPDKIDLHKETQRQLDIQETKEKSGTNTGAGLDLTTYQRQKEIALRETRKTSLINFIEFNEFKFSDYRLAYEEYRSLTAAAKENGRVSFEVFCKLLKLVCII